MAGANMITSESVMNAWQKLIKETIATCSCATSKEEETGCTEDPTCDCEMCDCYREDSYSQSTGTKGRITTMQSTNVTLRINMGMLGDFHEGLPGDRLEIDEALKNFEDLKTHIGDILPSPDDLDHLDEGAHIKEVSLKTLQLCTFGLYNIQFTVTVQHDVQLKPQTIQEIVEIIFEHGANSPITFDETPNYFLYPYESEIRRIVGDDEIVVGLCVGCATSENEE